ncbi:hypothetical protein GPECTOR_61g807 [Gonium pectorale]|uniref:Uncharacterized protein n=1 Tax=Gonium pectorale TaxID=33097 RepID=A0A150G4V8_GONPE|nr:hypothetical protein GPECTOR_61g807 [Gonium pectorale]|eukprot:KXZ44854.1 hypothetical protein GPECTOR_61g807 [Gonium pectorale]
MAGFEVCLRLAEAVLGRTDAANQAGRRRQKAAARWGVGAIPGGVSAAGPAVAPVRASDAGGRGGPAAAQPAASAVQPAGPLVAGDGRCCDCCNVDPVAYERVGSRTLILKTGLLLFSLGLPKYPASPPGPDVAAALRPLRKAAFMLKLAGEIAVLGLSDHRPGRELPAAASHIVARVLPEAARLLQVLRPLTRGGGDEELVDSSLALLLSVFPLPATAAARAASAGSESDGGSDHSGDTGSSASGRGSYSESDGGCDAADHNMASGSGVRGGVGCAGNMSSGDSGSRAGAASGDAASWRQLLLVELRLPALLGAALEQLDEAGDAGVAGSGGGKRLPERITSLNTIVVKALAALAAWAPGELARMVAAADRTAAVGRGHGGPLPTTALLRQA